MSQLLYAILAIQCLFYPIAVDDPQPEKDDVRACEVAERFVAAFLDRNLPATMKVVRVPWCLDAREIIDNQNKLEEKFRKLFREMAPKMYKLHVREVATLAAFRERKKSPETRGASLGEVLSKRHRVVLLEVEHEGKFSAMWIGVNLDATEAKVVGAVD